MLSHPLNENQILNIWNEISSHCHANYLVAFPFGALKDVEISMYGLPISPADMTVEAFYSEDEYKIVYKLNDLHSRDSYDLGDVFSICITTAAFTVNDSVYKCKEEIGNGYFLYIK